ncbi:MAG: tRNA 2-selenouridine(34) synthase MnmH [Pseudomonadota bacterium]
MSTSLPSTNDYPRLFLNDVPLLDLRAPVEFAEGAFPLAVNIPLLSDEERHRVGIRYKEQGQDAAIELGYRLVSAQEKSRRIALWSDWVRAHPDGVLYCFRGGLRSRLTQKMLAEEAGLIVPRVVGGYKALRRFLLDMLSRRVAELPFVVLGGRTGCGKTALIQTLDRSLDLEGFAHHRGSAFGRRPTPQPAQIDIDNRIAIALLRLSGARPILVEDEGRAIGSREVPLSLFGVMQNSPLVLLEASVHARAEQSFKDYVLDALAEFGQLFGEEEGFERYAEQTRASLSRIHKRLGGMRHKHLTGLLEDSLDAFRHGDDAGMREFVLRLLVEYYDPMYDYQIGKKQGRIVFRGDRDEVLAWWNGQAAQT